MLWAALRMPVELLDSSASGCSAFVHHQNRLREPVRTRMHHGAKRRIDAADLGPDSGHGVRTSVDRLSQVASADAGPSPPSTCSPLTTRRPDRHPHRPGLRSPRPRRYRLCLVGLKALLDWRMRWEMLSERATTHWSELADVVAHHVLTTSFVEESITCWIVRTCAGTRRGC